MQISKSYKWQIRDFETKSIWVSISHEEIGLSDSNSVLTIRDNAAVLSREVEALLLIELVKQGKIHANQIKEKLEPWITKVNGD